MARQTATGIPVAQPAPGQSPALYADEAGGPFHHVIFTQAGGWLREGRVHVASHWNGNLRAYGILVPGTFVVLPEDRRAADERGVPLDDSLRPLLLRGFFTRYLWRRSWAYLRARQLIHHIVAETSFVQLQHVSSFGIMAGLAAARMDKPFYMDVGGTLQEPPGASVRRPLHKRLSRRFYLAKEKKLAGSLKMLIAVSPRLHELFPPTPAAKIVVTHSMIERSQIFRRNNAGASSTLNVLAATRMIESKGIHHLLKAVKRLIDQGRELRVRLAGVGDYLPSLRELVVQLGLGDRVEFLGGIPAGEGLWSYYRQADVVVLPSLGYYEGTPRTILEAWASGAAVVATTVGGIPTLVRHDQDGLLVAPGDEDALAEAIRRIQDDADLRTRLVSNGYLRAETLTFENRLTALRDAFARYLPGLLPGEVR